MKKKKSLFDAEMDKPSFKKKFNEEEKRFEIEYQIATIMEAMGITQKDLARILEKDKSVISKDLGGALRRAGVSKISSFAEALDCEFIPLFVPKKKVKRVKKKLISEKLLA